MAGFARSALDNIYAFSTRIVLPIGIAYWPLLSGGDGPVGRCGRPYGPAGSWAGPAWFKMLLGLGATRVVGGRKRGNFMYLYHNCPLVNKKMLEVFVHTSFSIRTFWERRDR